jgi:serine/threonine-protein kinase HipA
MSQDSLDIYWEGDLIGHLVDGSPLAFEYDSGWLSKKDHFALLGIPKVIGPQSGPMITSFFENLLPEAELREYLTSQYKVGSLFGLLWKFAGDTIGGFIMIPSGAVIEALAYEKTTWEKLAKKIQRDGIHNAGGLLEASRISIAGAQRKFSIAIFNDDQVMLPLGVSPSTHIVKPEIIKFENIWRSALNEAIIMQTASFCGLKVAETFYEPLTESCVVKRFDRFFEGESKQGNLKRVVQYDFCQLFGKTSDRKYQQDGGPGFVDCANLIKKYSFDVSGDIKSLVQWLFFNLMIGNHDGHAKNLSINKIDGKFHLSPFYDLMSTQVYKGISSNLAMSVNGQYEAGKIGAKEIAGFCEELNLQRSYVNKVAEDLFEKLPGSLGKAILNCNANDPKSQSFTEKLKIYVESNSRKLMKRIA